MPSETDDDRRTLYLTFSGDPTPVRVRTLGAMPPLASVAGVAGENHEATSDGRRHGPPGVAAGTQEGAAVAGGNPSRADPDALIEKRMFQPLEGRDEKGHSSLVPDGAECGAMPRMQSKHEQGAKACTDRPKDDDGKGKFSCDSGRELKRGLSDLANDGNIPPMQALNPHAEREPAPKLGPGWTVTKIKRISGKTAGRVDLYWHSPGGKKFRSYAEIDRFKDILDSVAGDEAKAWGAYLEKEARLKTEKRETKHKAQEAAKRTEHAISSPDKSRSLRRDGSGDCHDAPPTAHQPFAPVAHAPATAAGQLQWAPACNTIPRQNIPSNAGAHPPAAKRVKHVPVSSDDPCSLRQGASGDCYDMPSTGYQPFAPAAHEPAQAAGWWQRPPASNVIPQHSFPPHQSSHPPPPPFNGHQPFAPVAHPPAQSVVRWQWHPA